MESTHKFRYIVTDAEKRIVGLNKIGKNAYKSLKDKFDSLFLTETNFIFVSGAFNDYFEIEGILLPENKEKYYQEIKRIDLEDKLEQEKLKNLVIKDCDCGCNCCE